MQAQQVVLGQPSSFVSVSMDKSLESPSLAQVNCLIVFLYVNPFAKRQILDSSKLKEFAENNFKLDVNGRKFSKRVENTVGKG